MIGPGKRKPGLVALATIVLSLAVAGYGGEATASGAHHMSGAELVRRWNQIAIDASGLDHTPVAPGESRAKAGLTPSPVRQRPDM